MKKTLAGALLTGAMLGTLAAGNALAADMPVKAPMLMKAPAPVYNWTGCYINAGAGYGMWNQEAQSETFPGLTALSPTDTIGGRGWFGTVGGGCDYQVSSSIVIGILGDYDFGDIKGTFADPNTGDFGTESEKWAWSIGGRVGWLLTPTILTYVSAGYTEAHFNQVDLNDFFTGLPTGASLPAQTYPGWFIGSGFDYAINFLPLPQGLFLRTEYRFSSYEDEDIEYTNSGAICDVGSCGLHSRKFVQTVRTSLVWRFNWH
ncbi:MAG TPA: outer membrane beta-barrel protein [Xanthobacteraceae bacterium]|jgi:outer membrane immunogenic protein|nr:outer membrane beta-barrel protein [Xanthobacteraceae bacterium]